ncbi:MAG TPA: isocitrate/isopropylmalate dehydrogenase family protein [Burkholderiales bacterium]|nr:isocitrate/isopropylmalate dehydrogenase family protein [Burkholderiales bacterium]
MSAPLRIAVLPGDGIGPEITAAAVAVLERLDNALGLGLRLEMHPVGLGALQRHGSTLPAQVEQACRAADGILVGPMDQLAYPPREQGGRNPSGELRLGLELYANIRPSRSREGLPHWGRTPMDLVIVRENTEGFYADRNMFQGVGEFMPTADLALSVRKISAEGSRRIATAGFELARARRRKVTAVHKSNVLKVTEGLWLREVRAVASQYPDVALEEQLVDSMAALLVRDAARYDVVLTTNMYGDILSDEAAELSGSLGLAASINAGDAHCMAQAQHGSAPDIAGKDLANPASLVLSAGMLLGWLARRHGRDALAEAERRLEASVDALIRNPATRTRDLGGTLGTREWTRTLLTALSSGHTPDTKTPRA